MLDGDQGRAPAGRDAGSDGVAVSVDAYDRWPNLAAMVFSAANWRADRPMLWAKRGGAYQPWSGRRVAADAAALAHALAGLGVADGDRVMLVSENRPEWLIADTAIMAAGGVTVPAYTTNTPAEHRHILDDCTPRVAIVSTRALAERLMPAALDCRNPPTVIAIEDAAAAPGSGIRSWSDTLAAGRRSGDQPPAGVADIGADRLACIIYTSGTGGVPKGVMLSHRAILHNCQGAFDLLTTFGLEDEVFLSCLPLSHSYEHTAGQFFPISIGAQIYYAEGPDKLSHNLIEARPTIMTAVPRLFEVLRLRILHGVERQGGLGLRLFHRTLALGRKRYENPSGMTVLDRLQDAVLSRVVRRKVAGRFGGRLKGMVSGGAPLNYDVGLFFTALGLQVLQGYGQTESAPIVSCGRPGSVRLDAVGAPMRGVEVQIAADGEILVRGPLVMNGYWNLPDATREAIDDAGWLHTGDIGVIDPDGQIRITDRKKDIIVNSGGDNIAPQRVEGFLTLQPEIAQAMVFGDRRPHLVALIVPHQQFAGQWAAREGRRDDLAALIHEPAFVREISAAVDRVNKTLSPLERVRRFALTAEPFSVANGMLTPTLKIRRHRIVDVYRGQLEALYGG